MKKKKIAVIGAGIVGLSTSFYLQSSGHQVSLYDKNNPGSGTSCGHANVIANYGVPALNQPDVWRNLFQYLFYSNSPLAISWPYLPSLIPWIIKFLKNCNSRSMNLTSKNIALLLNSALPTYQSLLNEISANDLITNKGVLYVWMNEKLKPSQFQIDIREKFNIEQVELNKDQISDLEPYLSSDIKGGWYFPKAHHTLNPDKILNKLFTKFNERKGIFIKDEVLSVGFSGQKFCINNKNYDDIVISCGAFSNQLVRQLEGYHVPLETERGYHLEFMGMQEFLSRPTSLIEAGMYLTPIHNSIRAAGTIELAGNKNKINNSRVKFIEKYAKKLIPKLENYQKTWLGFRPTLPDCLPVIGKSLKHDNAYYAFGHNHLGWTLGPVTGKIITNLINNKDEVNPALKIDRFFR